MPNAPAWTPVVIELGQTTTQVHKDAGTSSLNMIEAIRQALHDEMEADDRVIVLGEDVGKDGGIFRVTDGLFDRFGDGRCIDTPVAEAAIAGATIGLALNGMRPVGEFQFSGFSYQAMHQFEAMAARYRKRTQGRFTVPVVFRMPYGAGVRALEHHSESKETYFAHTPGVKVVIPSGPAAAYSMLRAAIRDPDPVFYMEPKRLYRRDKEDVEVGPEVDVERLGGPIVVREGDDCTIVAYGAMLPVAHAAAADLADDDVSAEVIDVRMIAPYDERVVHRSVQKTGRCVVVHEAHRTLGFGAEVAGRILEDEATLFRLEAPMARVTGADVHVPLFARENAYMPDAGRVSAAVRATMEYGATATDSRDVGSAPSGND